MSEYLIRGSHQSVQEIDRRNRKVVNIFIILLLFAITSCDEFYDEEFEEAAAETARGDIQRTNFSADLETTDSSVPNLSGTASINFRDDSVSIDVKISGVPENFTQVHYDFLEGDCRSLEREFQANLTSTKAFNITETLSFEAFQSQLNTAPGEVGGTTVDLQGKSIIIQAFPTFPGIPNPTGVEGFRIACGELAPAQEDNVPDVTIPTPGPGSPTDTGDVGTEGFPPGDNFPDRGDVGTEFDTGSPFPSPTGTGDVGTESFPNGNGFPDRGDVGTENL